MRFGGSFDRFAVLVVLAAMAVSRPLLDLFGENAEFFLARRSPRVDIVVVGLVIGIAIPLAIGLFGLIGGRIGRGVFAVLSGVLVAVLVRLVFVLVEAPEWVAFSLALVGGAAGVWALNRFDSMRQAARFLVFAPLLFTGLFFLATPTAALLLGDAEFGGAADAERSAPLIWIVFDELPAASIMDATGDVYADRFPNFGRLAEDGIWFPNAVTVEQQTEHSVPAILTGVNPDHDLSPFAGQYPFNIFTALAESHDLAAYESITHLCPTALCNASEEVAPPGVRAELLATDISIVAGHTLLPRFVSDSLPEIDQGWGYFGGDIADFDVIAEFLDAFDQDPRRPLEQAASRIAEGFDGRPPFLFVHALVPHHPWQLLPTGQTYPLTGQRSPGTTRTGWGSDEWLLDQGRQRHLLNVGYADFALGEILDALDQAGLYDDAMIVVMADHGIAIKADVEHQRYITPDTIGEIAAVPVLIKVPGRQGGIVDSRRATTLDVVPTVAEVMGIELDWIPEGASLIGPDPHQQSTTSDTPTGSVEFGVDGQEVLRVARELAARFPNPDPFVLLPVGAPDLLGQRVDTSDLPGSGLRVQISDGELFEDVDPAADVVPVWMVGRVIGAAEESIYAVIVNGTVEAVTRSYLDGRLTYVQAVLPPRAFRSGNNVVQLARWNGSGLEAVESENR